MKRWFTERYAMFVCAFELERKREKVIECPIGRRIIQNWLLDFHVIGSFSAASYWPSYSESANESDPVDLGTIVVSPNYPITPIEVI